METPKRGTSEQSRYGRKRKLTEQFKNVVQESKNVMQESKDEIFSTNVSAPSQIPSSSVNSGRNTRKSAKGSTNQLLDGSQLPTRKKSQKRKPAAKKDKTTNKDPADDDIDALISEELLNTTFDNLPDESTFEMVDEILDPANFRPAKINKKFIFKAPAKLPVADHALE